MASEDKPAAGGDAQPTGALAVVGEREGTEVSVQLLQDVYNEITGKSEELNKGYDLSFRVTIEDLKQLHHRVKQLCEQYSIKSENESVTIYHEEDTREVFSSFDRFKLSDPSALSAVESIVLKYNFLVILPKSRRPQSYSLSIRLASRVTILHKLREELPVHVFKMMGARTAMVTVQYVDYMVARNLLDGVDRWIKGLPSYEHSKWFKFVRRNSEYARYIAKYGLGAIGVWLIYTLVPRFIASADPNFQTLAYFSLFSSVGAFTLFRLGRFLGSQVERALDETFEISYLKLTRGDEKRIQDAQRHRVWSFVRGGIGVVGSIAVGVISNYVVKWLAA